MKPLTYRALTCSRAAHDQDAGQVTAFVVCTVAGLWLFAGIVVDGGLALAGKARALDIAQEAARTGAQQLDVGRLRAGRQDEVRLREDKAVAAARTYVTSTGDQGAATVRGDSVVVRVTHHQPAQILQLVGVHSLTVSGEATATAARTAP